MIKTVVLAFATAAAALGAGTAHAGGGVSWSIGINTPIVGTVISNSPGYAGGYGSSYRSDPYDSHPNYSGPYYPDPYYYAPGPAYRYAPPVYVAPTYVPLPVYRGVPGYVHDYHPRHHRGYHERHHRGYQERHDRGYRGAPVLHPREYAPRDHRGRRYD